jgi:nucleotide-binding universal stress UspA family protein
MNGFRNILVPTDFGDPAARALELATLIASRFESKITLMHAFYVPPLAYANGIYVPMDDMIKEADRALADALAKLKTKYALAEAVLVSGLPWEQVLHVAKEQKCDLIAMGTHGRHGLSRIVLGSVAERIVRMSPVPVLTVG